MSEVFDGEEPDNPPVPRFGLKTELEELLQMGTAISSVSENGGMAAVHVRYDPYAATWHVYVDWSDSSKVFSVDADLVRAVTSLRSQLKNEYDARKAVWTATKTPQE